MNWVVLDSDWEAELCRVEEHPRVRAYVKNHNLGFRVPYLHRGDTHHYLPDFIVRVEDGHGEEDLLNLVVEVKGYRGEDAKDKKLTMDTYWVPGVNALRGRTVGGRSRLTSVYEIEADFEAKLASEVAKLIDGAIASAAKGA